MATIGLNSIVFLFLAIISLSSHAVACETAIFDLISRVINIPTVNIGGRMFMAALEEQGNSSNFRLLHFTPLEKEKNTSDDHIQERVGEKSVSNNSSCETATYDQLSGTLNLPSVEVGPSVYRLELNRVGNSNIFELDEKSMQRVLIFRLSGLMFSD